ncbi:unnamed protein product [Cunninghamella blakesleeana]
MPAITTSILSWSATIGVAASAAYANRRNSQDESFSLSGEHKTENHISPLVTQTNRHFQKYSHHKSNDIHILTFVLGKD